MCTMVLYSDGQGYYNVDPFGDDIFFDSINKAKHFSTAQRALDTAIALGRRKIKVDIVHIETIHTVKSIQNVKMMLKAERKKAQEYVDSVKALTEEETEDLSNAKWNAYKKCLRFLRETKLD